MWAVCLVHAEQNCLCWEHVVQGCHMALVQWAALDQESQGFCGQHVFQILRVVAQELMASALAVELG